MNRVDIERAEMEKERKQKFTKARQLLEQGLAIASGSGAKAYSHNNLGLTLSKSGDEVEGQGHQIVASYVDAGATMLNLRLRSDSLAHCLEQLEAMPALVS